MEECCAVCAEPLEWLAYGPCGHRDVCSTCTARLRFILDDKVCCICKQECPTVVVTKALGDYTKGVGDFGTLPVGTNEGKLSNYWFHSDTQAYFDDEQHYKMIKAMCELSCSACDNTNGTQEPEKDFKKHVQEFKDKDQLTRHLFHAHKLHMCTLCLEGRKIFICEQKLYTWAQLEQHLSRGDSEVDGSEIERGGFMGHPICKFCRKRFYGDNEIFLHMSSEHYSCHICKRRHPGNFAYYRNYNDLEEHFSREHFLCENMDCLAKKFLVFASEAELKRHNVIEHAGNMSRSKRHAALQIPVSFQYRRRGCECELQQIGRGRWQRMNDWFSAANQASMELINTENAIRESILTATSENIGISGESPNQMPSLLSSDMVASSSMSTLSTDSSRYPTALSQIELNSPLEESAFPPLPRMSNNASQNFGSKVPRSHKSMAALLHGRQGKVRVLNAPESRRSVGPVQLSSPYDMNSSLYQTNSYGNPNYSGGPFMHNTSEICLNIRTGVNAREMVPNSDDFPPILGRQHVPLVSATENQSCGSSNAPLMTIEETRAANRILNENIQSGLGGDKQQFAAFKDISGLFRKGDFDAQKYYAYISKMGLLHLVSELARLCPDQDKGRELLEAHKVGLKNNSQHAVNKVANQIMGIQITSGSIENCRKGKGIYVGCNEDETFSSNADSGSCTGKVSDKVEVLFKDGYQNAKGKSKLWETQDMDRISGPSGLSSVEPIDHCQRSPLSPDCLNSYSCEKWECNACTLLNKQGNTHCLACRTEKPDVRSRKDPSYEGKINQKKKTSKGKSKPWETQALDRISGPSGLSLEEPSDNHQSSPSPDGLSSFSDEKWACNACTLLNKHGSTHCLACRTERHDDRTIKEPSYGGKVKQKKKTSKGKSKPCEAQTLDRISQPSGLSSDEPTDYCKGPPPDGLNSYSSEMWACNVCTLLNKQGSTRCLACRTERPDGRTIKEPSDGGKAKQKNKRSKPQRLYLDDGSASTESSQSSSVGVWGNGGGQKLIYIAQKGSVFE